MYRNYKAEMARNNVTLEKVGNAIGKSSGVVSLKLNGKVPITFDEALLMKKCVNSNLPLEVLFEKYEESA